MAFLFSLLPYSSALFATCEHIVRCGLSSVSYTHLDVYKRQMVESLKSNE